MHPLQGRATPWPLPSPLCLTPLYHQLAMILRHPAAAMHFTVEGRPFTSGERPLAAPGWYRKNQPLPWRNDLHSASGGLLCKWGASDLHPPQSQASWVSRPLQPTAPGCPSPAPGSRGAPARAHWGSAPIGSGIRGVRHGDGAAARELSSGAAAWARKGGPGRWEVARQGEACGGTAGGLARAGRTRAGESSRRRAERAAPSAGGAPWQAGTAMPGAAGPGGHRRGGGGLLPAGPPSLPPEVRGGPWCGMGSGIRSGTGSAGWDRPPSPAG